MPTIDLNPDSVVCCAVSATERFSANPRMIVTLVESPADWNRFKNVSISSQALRVRWPRSEALTTGTSTLRRHSAVHAEGIILCWRLAALDVSINHQRYIKPGPSAFGLAMGLFQRLAPSAAPASDATDDDTATVAPLLDQVIIAGP